MEGTNIKYELLNHSHLKSLCETHRSIFRSTVSTDFFRVKYGLDAQNVTIYSFVAIEDDQVVGFIGGIEQSYSRNEDQIRIVQTGDYMLLAKFRGTGLFDELYKYLLERCKVFKIDVLMAFNSMQTYKVGKRWEWVDIRDFSRFHVPVASKYRAKLIKLLHLTKLRERRFLNVIEPFLISMDDGFIFSGNKYCCEYNEDLIKMKSNYNKVCLRIENCVMIIKYAHVLTVAYLQLNDQSDLKKACIVLRKIALSTGFSDCIFHVDSSSLEAEQLRSLFDEKESFKLSGNKLNHSIEISKVQFNLFEMDII